MSIVIIDCVEKRNSQMNGVVNFLNEKVNSLGFETNLLKIKDIQIAKCTECRCCTQKKGEKPAKCVIKDDMNDILETLDNAEAFIILADRHNLFTRNKVHQKFSQRLVAFYYWPYGQVQSKPRKAYLDKNSILINYNTTKYFMNHSFYTTKLYMEQTSNSLGAEVLDTQIITPKDNLVNHYEKRLEEMVVKLISSLTKKVS